MYYTAEGRAQKALARARFAGDVLAVGVEEGAADGYSKELDVNGDKATITVVKV